MSAIWVAFLAKGIRCKALETLGWSTFPLAFGCWITWFIWSWERNYYLQSWANSQNDNYFHWKQPKTKGDVDHLYISIEIGDQVWKPFILCNRLMRTPRSLLETMVNMYIDWVLTMPTHNLSLIFMAMKQKKWELVDSKV